MINKGSIPVSILHLHDRSLYGQVSASDAEMRDRVDELMKGHRMFKVRHDGTKYHLEVWRDT